MSRVLDWLLGLVSCQPLIAMLMPATPVDPEAHLNGMLAEIEKMDDEKAFLDRQLLGMRRDYVRLMKEGKGAAARVLRGQMQEHVSRCKALEKRNLLLVGQYNELRAMREESTMVKSSVLTTTMLREQASTMRRDMKALGGADGVQTVLDDIAEVKQDAADLVGFASRSLLPEDIRGSGVAAAPLSLDEELDAYLGELEEGESKAASSVHEPPSAQRDPYGQEGMLVGN